MRGIFLKHRQASIDPLTIGTCFPETVIIFKTTSLLFSLVGFHSDRGVHIENYALGIGVGCGVWGIGELGRFAKVGCRTAHWTRTIVNCPGRIAPGALGIGARCDTLQKG